MSSTIAEPYRLAARPAPTNVDRWETGYMVGGPDVWVDTGTYSSTADLLQNAPHPMDSSATCIQHKDPLPTHQDKMAALRKGVLVGALAGTALTALVGFGAPAVLDVLGGIANVVFWPAAHASAVPFAPAWVLAAGAAAGAAIGGFDRYSTTAETTIKTDGKLYEKLDNGDTTLYFDTNNVPSETWNLGVRSSAPNYQI